MKTKLLISLALPAACAVLATGPSASAKTIELLQNGRGTSDAGWEKSSFSVVKDGGTGVSWFAANNSVGWMSQTVALADDQVGLPLTASVTVCAPWGSRICNARVYELDGSGKALATNTVMEVKGTVGRIEENEHRLEFVPQAGTRQLKWEMNGQDQKEWAGVYGPRFRNCSLALEKEDPPPEETPLTPLDCSTIVYRGQLNLISGEAATNATAYTKTMHFRVYDAPEASTPLWKVDNVQVTVNSDGSFVKAFGDEALAALIATGKVTHVGLAIGPSADTAVELKPRRELRPVAAVNRALTAEGAALDVRVGNLLTENALVAADATVSRLEVAGRVTAPGAGQVEVSPLVVGPDERTRLMRGSGVNVFAGGAPIVLATNVSPVVRGQVLAEAPSDGIALVSSSASGERSLRCPAVVQYCIKGESVRAPTSDDKVNVTFFPFLGK